MFEYELFYKFYINVKVVGTEVKSLIEIFIGLVHVELVWKTVQTNLSPFQEDVAWFGEAAYNFSNFLLNEIDILVG